MLPCETGWAEFRERWCCSSNGWEEVRWTYTSPEDKQSSNGVNRAGVMSGLGLGLGLGLRLA